jgi:hypothetical protein
MRRVSAPEPWGRRIDVVLERAGQAPLASVQKRPAGSSTVPYLLPPAGEQRVQRVEERLGLTLPACLRELFVSYTAGMAFSWHLELAPDDNLPFDSPVFGGCELALSGISKLQERWDTKVGRDLLRVMSIRNGDVIGLRMRRNSAGPAAVEYFDHETDRRIFLADDFVDFLNRWTRLATVGPEIWLLEPFLGEAGLDVTGEPARELRRWFWLDAI